MKKLWLMFISLTLISCSAVYTNMSKSDLTIQTSMSSTIWLDATNPETTKIFVQARNTSDNPNFGDLTGLIKADLVKKGYLITNNPNEARFILQANVLKAILDSKSINQEKATSDALATGAATGFLVGGSGGNNASAIGVGALAGLGAMYFDAKTKDNYYIIQVDIKISEAAPTPYTASVIQTSQQGDNASLSLNNNVKMSTKSYNSTLSIVANKVNLTEAEAITPMKNAIASSLAGLF